MAQQRRDELGERTREPTALRLREARRRGQVPRSVDLTSAAAALGAVVALGLIGPGLLDGLTQMAAAFLDGRNASIDPSAGGEGAPALGGATGPLWLAGAMLAATAALAAVVALTQVGAVVAPERIHPDWGRLRPGRGLARLLSARTLVRAAGILAKLAAVAAVGYWTIRPALPRLAAAGRWDAWHLAGEAGRLAGSLAIRVGLCLLALGLADYVYQRWQHRRDLRMTYREWREDMRTIEGDWRPRQRRRQIARELNDWRAARDVPSASLVVFDPHGCAVALRRGEADEAPRVVATGTGWSALRIRRTADLAGVPTVADAAAAREVREHCAEGEAVSGALRPAVERMLDELRPVRRGAAGRAERRT